MDIKEIRYFLMVAREGSFTKAAEKLYMTQPALNRKIADLEAELGMSLFRRSGRNIELTPSGVAFGQKAQKLERDYYYRGSVMEDKTAFVPAEKTTSSETAENEFIGEGHGKGGTPIVVKVTMDGERIAAIEILEDSETVGFADRAKEEIPAAIIAAQNTEVDSIAGVTLTSEGIKEAVANALAQSK